MSRRNSRLATSVLLISLCFIACPISAEPEAPAPLGSVLTLVADLLEELLSWFPPESGSSCSQVSGTTSSFPPDPNLIGDLEPNG